jgi:hypothetical protein
MALSAIDRQRILDTIKRLREGSAGHTLDDTTVETLSRIFCGTCGYTAGCPGTFTEGLRDQPYATLLSLLVCPAVIPLAVPPGIPPIDLPIYATTFGILAGTTVTNSGPTVIHGDLGLSPGTSVTGFFPIDGGPGNITGTYHITDTAAADAQLALTAAYNDFAGRPGATVIAGDLAGQTLAPGLYKSTSSLAVGPATGNLTLDAQGDVNAVWIFQIASTLTIENGKSIVLAGGANPANIFWQVGSSATLGTTSVFQGSILALTSISVNTGASVVGRLLARNGAVTLLSNNVQVPL